MYKPIWNYFFVDLDNTLIYADSGTWVKDHNPEGKLVTFADKSVYSGVLRPGALKFLSDLRAIPNSKVFMLTASIMEYAAAWNREFGLGFETMDIFAREDQRAGNLDRTSTRFQDAARVVLFDDMTSFDHRHTKIPFLSPITPWGKVVYVQVPYFNGVPGALNRSLRRELIRKGLELSS